MITQALGRSVATAAAAILAALPGLAMLVAAWLAMLAVEAWFGDPSDETNIEEAALVLYPGILAAAGVACAAGWTLAPAFGAPRTLVAALAAAATVAPIAALFAIAST
jgi:hypothetical protein